jgi:uncharacterized repeat protein (TIGR03837 family)
MPSLAGEPVAHQPSRATPLGSRVALRWDVFCRVVDNFGDIGFCWRLACDLAAQGQIVRLWVDDPTALAWMAPNGRPGVVWRRWEESLDETDPGDVVIEAFGCEPPGAWVARMAEKRPSPVWINLEYLSAEAYVERCHGLPSPQACGLTKWFYFPGFTRATGGLLREDTLSAERAAFQPRPWLAQRGLAVREGEHLVSLFCYAGAPLQALLGALAAQGPTLLLAAPGPGTDLCAEAQWPEGVRWQALPWLSQMDYDRLLWSCDLNLVRGEDSLVRALWAARPSLWQAYPQFDRAHAQKISAFLDQHLSQADDTLAAELRSAMACWNGLHPGGATALHLPALEAGQSGTGTWRHLAERHTERLLELEPLGTGLRQFVAQRR